MRKDVAATREVVEALNVAMDFSRQMLVVASHLVQDIRKDIAGVDKALARSLPPDTREKLGIRRRYMELYEEGMVECYVLFFWSCEHLSEGSTLAFMHCVEKYGFMDADEARLGPYTMRLSGTANLHWVLPALGSHEVYMDPASLH